MIEQRTPEWFSARAGKVTASRIADLMARTKAGPGASRTNYMTQLLAERLTGEVQDSYTNAAMQHGIDTEPTARAACCFQADVDVAKVGFIEHPSIAMSGASPDGLVGSDGLVEIKCPQPTAHAAMLDAGAVPGKYQLQMQWQMACTERAWCDFVSFNLSMREKKMQLWIKRIPRDDKKIAEIEREVSAFLTELDEKVRDLRATYATQQTPLLMAG